MLTVQLVATFYASLESVWSVSWIAARLTQL